MVVPFRVVFDIGVAEGPKTIPDVVTSPPLDAAVADVLPELTVDVVNEPLGRVEVAATLPDVSPVRDSKVDGELDLGIGVFVELAEAMLEPPACRLNTASSAPTSRHLLERKIRNIAESSGSTLIFSTSRIFSGSQDARHEWSTPALLLDQCSITEKEVLEYAKNNWQHQWTSVLQLDGDN